MHALNITTTTTTTNNNNTTNINICNEPFLNSKRYNMHKQHNKSNQTKLHNIKNRIRVINHQFKDLLKGCILRSFLKQSKDTAFLINAGNAFHNLGML